MSNKPKYVATDPDSSVWVLANAGAGKTTILKNRYLRLLLKGVEVEKILCLTFTNAAANEMKERILKDISSWASISENDLQKNIKSLIGDKPDKKLLKRARSFFTQIIDRQDLLNIRTIHSFCQAILQRFPLEAGISPHFEIIDERKTHLLLKEAFSNLVEREFSNNEASDFKKSFSLLNDEFDGSVKLYNFLSDVSANISELRILLQSDFIKVLKSICKKYSLTRDDEEEKLLGLAKDGNIQLLLDCWYKDFKKYCNKIQLTQSFYQQSSYKNFVKYCGVFLRKKDSKPKEISSIIAKKYYEDLTNGGQHISDLINVEQERLLDIYEKIKSIRLFEVNKAFLIIVRDLLFEYEKIKKRRSFLDYNDQIIKTVNLLQNSENRDWVSYKLDAKIEHILLDEAQDTSPIQWKIIQALVEEFFSGETKSEKVRTLFVVGDEKQSIYSFQGADILTFTDIHEFFTKKALQVSQSWQDVALIKSFRSTPVILQLVDQIFSDEIMKNAISKIGLGDIKHVANRSKDYGKVEIWDIVISDEEEYPKNFDEVLEGLKNYSNRKNNKQNFANFLAQKISSWLKEGKLLYGKNPPRKIRPGDILILVQQRERISNQIVRALHDYGIASSGIDRLKLQDHIAVKDLISLAEFLSFPEDDLRLAEALKSPIYNLNDGDLVELCYNRQNKSLFDILKEKNNKIYQDLFDLKNKKDEKDPYMFFFYLLEIKNIRKKMVSRLGDQVNEIIDEFLNVTAEFCKNNPPALDLFLSWFKAEDIVVKRDVMQTKDQVKIMTVHGAKGLQAPIVILADTVETKQKYDRVLWDKEGICYFAKGEDNKYLQTLKEHKKFVDEQENLRLLYVALTRAEDEIYVAGWQSGKRKINDNSWYNIIKNAAQEMEPGDILTKQENGVLSLECNWDRKKSFTTKEKEQEKVKITLPKFAITKFTKKQNNAEIISPSQNIGKVLEKNISRGKLIHYILEKFDGKNTDVIDLILAKQNLDTEGIKEKIIMVAEKFPFVFSKNSFPEVPISGIIDGKTISGRMDRIIEKEDEVIIIDFKTEKNPPKNLTQVPQQYIKQLSDYKKLVKQIYLDKRISSNILWIENMQMISV